MVIKDTRYKKQIVTESVPEGVSIQMNLLTD